jgi:putative DNA primase/helicase
MISLAQSEVPIAPEALDGNSHLLNLQSGTLDLRSGEFRRHDPGDLITKLAPISYDPDAKCDTWDAFLHKIMDGNADLIAFLKRVVGYSLTGETSEQCLFILHGSGANGKSTFVETIHALLSDYAQKTETKSFMQRQSEGVRNDLARLNGVRFASAVEIGRGQKLDEALIKEVTGGDRIAARFLFKEFFEFQPEFKLFLACNHKPEIRGTDEGMWRRVILVPFDVTIPPEERNKRLPAKLRNELPGILNWAIGGYQEWRRDGLQEPEEVKAATQSYREEMDLLAHFLHECCELGEKKEVPTGELFNAYEVWCKKNGEQAVTKRTFGKMLAERGFRDGSKTKSGVTKRYRFGLSLLPPEF